MARQEVWGQSCLRERTVDSHHIGAVFGEEESGERSWMGAMVTWLRYGTLLSRESLKEPGFVPGARPASSMTRRPIRGGSGVIGMMDECWVGMKESAGWCRFNVLNCVLER